MRRGRIQRLADAHGLGGVAAVHRPRLAPPLGFSLGVLASLLATLLYERSAAGADTGPGHVVWPVVGVTLALVFLGLAIAAALDQGRRIAVCAGGLLHVRRGRIEAVPWTAVRNLRRRSRREYALEAEHGVLIEWDEELRGRDRLYAEIEERVTPLLVSAARERLNGGEHVAFDGLLMAAAALTAEGAAEALPWEDVESVTFGPLGAAIVRRRGQASPWFSGLVPNQAAFRLLTDELAAAPRSRPTPNR
jgi:hypothetical protein